MQSIQAIENAALEVPRRSSPFRALVWKEWRQQRWIFFSLAGLAYVLLVSALIVARSGRFHDADKNNAAGVLCACATFIGYVGVLVLSANAFSGEREDNTSQFLETIPCSRSKLFQVKLGLVLFLVLLEVIPAGTTALIMQLKVSLGDFMVGAGLTAAGVLVLATVPALVASFGGSVIATILASMPVFGACSAYMYYSPVLLARFVPFGSEMGKHMLTALFTVLMLATILVAAWRMWTRVERTWRRSLHTAAATAGLLIAYVELPSAVAYFYVTCFAPLSYFLGSSNPIARAYASAPSPNGKYVICSTGYSGWGALSGRAALLDVDSGRSRWMTRFYDSGAPIIQRFWSPSGYQFVLEEADAGLWPLASEEANWTYFVVDARSGEKHSFDDLWPVVKTLSSISVWWKLVGWYSEQVFALSDGRDILFADVKSHNVLRCTMPNSLPNARIGGASSWWLPITERGIFATAEEDRQGGLRVLRYAPELSEAEILVLPGIPDTACFINASRDGRRLIIRVELSYPKVEEYIVRLQDGVEVKLLNSSNCEADGLISSSWHVMGFLPGSYKLFLYRDTELGLFDADSHDLRRIPLKVEAKIWTMSDAQLSPCGGFAIVRLAKATGETHSLVVDLRLGTSWDSDASVKWLGEDHLLSHRIGSSVILNRDGTGARPLLK